MRNNFSKTYRLALIRALVMVVTVVSGSPSAAWGQAGPRLPCANPKIVIAYINGVLTTEQEAMETTKTLEELLGPARSTTPLNTKPFITTLAA